MARRRASSANEADGEAAEGDRSAEVSARAQRERVLEQAIGEQGDERVDEDEGAGDEQAGLAEQPEVDDEGDDGADDGEVAQGDGRARRRRPRQAGAGDEGDRAEPTMRPTPAACWAETSSRSRNRTITPAIEIIAPTR